MSQLAPP